MPQDQLSTRTIAGRYRLDEEIGRGGAGVVWRGEDTLLRRAVAIKEVAPTQLRDRVLREARAAARVSHPRLVTMFDVVEEDGNVFLVQELVRGGSLKDEVVRNGPLDVERAAEVGLQLTAALEALHREGIVHRDVKPSNVMFAGDDTVKLADLGIASVAGDPDLTNTGVVLGSPHYMAPEQATGERVDAKADLWSLGATLFYAVEGRPPYEGPVIAAMTSVVHDPVPPAPRAGRLGPIIGRLMEKDPSARPDDAQVRRMLLDEPTVAYTRTEVEPTAVAAPVAPPVAPRTAPAAAPATRQSSSGGRGWAVALVTVIALLIGGFALAAAQSDDPDDGGGDTSKATDTTAPATTGRPSTTQAPTTTAKATTTTAEAKAPAGTQTYTNDKAGYSLAYPDGWTKKDRSGNAVDFSEPDTGTYLRVDWTDKPGESPQAAWEQQETSFSKEHDGYQRIRMEETTYQGHEASLWEYTYRSGDTTLHAYNLGFVTDDRGFALNFQTHEERWQAAQPTWEQLKANFTIRS